MPQQQNERLSFAKEIFVSGIDYSEARDILELTTNKQKQLRRQQRQRSQDLRTQLLLKRTYSLVCDLLNSDCCPCSSSSCSPGEITRSSSCSSLPLSTVDTNKRKSSSNDDDNDRIVKKSKSLMDKYFDITNDKDILQFLLELNAVKVLPRY